MLIFRRPAFTLIEVITVATIITILIAISIATYGHLRASARDSRRVLNITQIQSALAAYHRDLGAYPATITASSPLAAGNQIYLNKVPSNPTPVEESCQYWPEYSYLAMGTEPNFSSYQLTFCLASDTAELSAGVHVATPNGIN